MASTSRHPSSFLLKDEAAMLNNRSGMSYHDDYVRKSAVPLQGGHSPLPLLTDRGAYLNFLEVQLERVSSAVMGIRSYDQYLADVQNLIVSLENRCTSNTNLCAAVQQCMEEIRIGVTKSIMEVTETYREDHRRIVSMQDSLASKLLLLEERLRSNEVENKVTFDNQAVSIKQHDERLTKITDHIKQDISCLSENHKKLKDRSKRNYEEHNAKLNTTMEVIQSKMGHITEDMDRRVEDLLKKDAENKVKIRNVESSFIQELADAKLEAINLSQNTSVRLDNKLHVLYSDISSFKEHVGEETGAQRRLMKDHVESTRSQQESFEREHSKEGERVQELLNQSRLRIDQLHDSHKELHEKSQDYQHRLSLLADDVDHSLNQIKNVHETGHQSQRQLQDLREHLHNMSLAPFGAETESPIRALGDTPIYTRERAELGGRATMGHDEGKEEAAMQRDKTDAAHRTPRTAAPTHSPATQTRHIIPSFNRKTPLSGNPGVNPIWMPINYLSRRVVEEPRHRSGSGDISVVTTSTSKTESAVAPHRNVPLDHLAGAAVKVTAKGSMRYR